MKLLLRKELRLSLHPTAPMFLALSAMLLIPGYPYLVAFFYTGLAVFFTCLSGRENQDVFYAMLLPVAKRDIVRARLLTVSLLEMAQVLLAIPFAILRQRLIPDPNPVGMDANIALFGFALGQLGLFNLVFFRVYYRDVRKVGTAFLWGSSAVFLWICLVEASAHAVPFVRDVLDTPDPLHLPQKLLTLLAGLALWALLTLRACRRAERDFDRQDL
ncbi:MAG: ABC-2 transporter permease [Aristaeellaceae bacterium]